VGAMWLGSAGLKGSPSVDCTNRYRTWPDADCSGWGGVGGGGSGLVAPPLWTNPPGDLGGSTRRGLATPPLSQLLYAEGGVQPLGY